MAKTIEKEGIHYYEVIVTDKSTTKRWIGNENTMELVNGGPVYFPQEPITLPLTIDERFDSLQDDVDYLILKQEGVI